jgi:hypothetical protein
MKKMSLILFCLVFGSCSHLESTSKELSFPYAAELLEKVQKNHSRKPASLSVSDISSKSPRRVYFSALYQQYMTMKDLLGHKNDLEFCPQFHHDKIKIDSGFVPKMSLFSSNELDENKKDYFPEVIFNKDFSLKDYHQTMKEEILTLCEDGVSDNFYKFDNLVTHYSGNPSFHKDPKAMASVLKIPVFANFYLIKMLEMPGFETYASESAFIDLSKTHWFETYVSEATRMRKNLIKNHMVRR